MYSHKTLTYRDMFAVWAIALLCLVSVSHSAPLACEDLVQPLDDVDPHNLEGEWAMVASSMKIIEAEEPVQQCDSISVYFYNNTYTKANRYGDGCIYSSDKISIEGPHYNFKVGQIYNISGTFFHTSCEDCVVLSFIVESASLKSEEFCLFSKRREVKMKELREFNAQVKCRKMPDVVLMDPLKMLCPVRPSRFSYA